MGYFRELPDVAYQNFLSDSLSSQSYIVVKNLFRRNKIRDDLEGVFTVFDKYEIQEGARPDNIAKELYGDDNRERLTGNHETSDISVFSYGFGNDVC